MRALEEAINAWCRRSGIKRLSALRQVREHFGLNRYRAWPADIRKAQTALNIMAGPESVGRDLAGLCDAALRPEIIKNPDAVTAGGQTQRGLPGVIYDKVMPDGTITYVEEVRRGKNQPAFKTM